MTEVRTPTPPPEKLLDKIAKLLRQSEDADLADRRAEAEAFHAKAFELMATYGVTEALARARKDGVSAATAATAASVYVSLQGRYVPMQVELLCAMAEAMSCKVVILPIMGDTTTKRCRVYGMADHLRRLASMWQMLAPQAQRGMELAHPGRWATSGEVVVHRRSWLLGFAEAIETRIWAAERSAAAEAGAVELYRSDRERAELAMRADYPNLRTTESNHRLDADAYLAGAASGETAELHKGLRS